MTINSIPISLSSKGLPTISLGGGAFSHSFMGRFLIRKINDKYELPFSLFMRHVGDLSCSSNQVIVLLRVDDLIITVSGELPVNLENPGISWNVQRIISFDGSNAIVYQDSWPVELESIPEQIVIGLETYHNRDGRYFVCKKEDKTANDI